MANHLQIYAKGEALVKGKYDLRTLDTVIGGSLGILDQLIAVQLGKRRLTDKLSRQIKYRTSIEDGSIGLVVELILDNPEVFLATKNPTDGYALGESLVLLYENAVTVLECVKRIQVTPYIYGGLLVIGSNTIMVGAQNVVNNNIFVEGNVLHVPDVKIIEAARGIHRTEKKRDRHFEAREIDTFSLKATGNASFVKRDYEVSQRVYEKTFPKQLHIVGRLDMMSFTDRTGILISSGDPYPVIWDEHLRSKIKDFADTDGVIFTVQRNSTFKNYEIGYTIIDCELFKHN